MHSASTQHQAQCTQHHAQYKLHHNQNITQRHIRKSENKSSALRGGAMPPNSTAAAAQHRQHPNTSTTLKTTQPNTPSAQLRHRVARRRAAWQSRLPRGHLRPRETLPSANIVPRDKAQRHRSRGARGAGAQPPAPTARLSHQKFQQHNSYQVRASEGVFYTQLGFQFCFIIKNTSPISELFRI